MKLWIGGIIDAAIGDDFRQLRNSIEKDINLQISNIDYGEGMSTWDVILVVSSNPPNEYVRYSKVSRETDVRLIVDFDSFLEVDSVDRSKMLGYKLLESIHRLSNKKIGNFDFTKLQQDVEKALNLNQFNTPVSAP